MVCPNEPVPPVIVTVDPDTTLMCYLDSGREDTACVNSDNNRSAPACSDIRAVYT